MRITILMIPTMKCNLACPVCHFKVEKLPGGYGFWGYKKFHEINAEVPWHYWIQHLNKYRPYHLEFTGGEPTIYPGFRDLVAHIPQESTWAITSNTLMKDVHDLPIDRCTDWTASYHWQDSPFFYNCQQLNRKMKGHFRVSFVVEFKRVKECIDKALQAQRMGFAVNVLRELNEGVDWKGTKEWDQVSALTKRKINVVDEDIPPSYEFESGFSCMGGAIYFCLMPDGKVYRCYSDAMRGRQIGEVSTYVPPTLPEDCTEPCLGCALDHRFRVKKLIGAVHAGK